MKDSMDIYNFLFNSVENQVILNNEVSVTQPHQFFFVWDSSKLWFFRKKIEVLFYFCSKCICRRWSVSGYIINNLKKVILCNAKKTNRIFTLLHVFAFGGLSLLAIEYVL